MKTSDFDFPLPQDRIAQHPTATRGESRLMVLRRGTGVVEHRRIVDLPDYVPAGSVVVLNDSRVRKARLYGQARPGGGSTEVLLLRRLDDRTWTALVSRGKRNRPGRRYLFPGGVEGTITAEDAEGKTIRFSAPVDDTYLEIHGHVPLPPYIRREDEPEDAERYQTVYARSPGSAASPTAGLHFTPALLDALAAKGARLVYVTLHVGLGTFVPIHADDLEEHRMHVEDYEIGETASRAVTDAKRDGRPVLAVGTTAMRTLESAWDPEAATLRRGSSRTDLFIKPGYVFRVPTSLLTNFHTPRSTLLVLVSAFAGRERILAAYAEAVESGYRFFSYGDAMLIL